MQAQRLTISPEGGHREEVTSLTLSPVAGVAGDHRSAKDGSVSLLSGEAEAEMRSLGGLCTGRFLANIVSEGLDYTTLHEGTRLAIGNCELAITRMGKPCYEACQLIQNGDTCPLPMSCAFARVLCGGTIQTNDEIMLHDR
jgi:cyclic pyranopterin monophosphate synthase